MEHQHVTLKEQIDEMKCENKDIDVHNSIVSTTQDGITHTLLDSEKQPIPV